MRAQADQEAFRLQTAPCTHNDDSSCEQVTFYLLFLNACSFTGSRRVFFPLIFCRT